MNQGTEENVWYLRIFSENHAAYGFTNDIFETHPDEEVMLMFRRYFQTDIVDPKDFPSRFWIKPAFARAHGKVLPPAHSAGGFLVVSRQFLDVLEQFDLGKFVSWPVTLLKKDKQTPFAGDWFMVWTGNRKKGFVREKSKNFRVPRIEDMKWLSIPDRDAVEDGDYVMDASVKDGPDIWRDPLLDSSLLLSDRLHGALKDAGLLKKLSVRRCPLTE